MRTVRLLDKQCTFGFTGTGLGLECKSGSNSSLCQFMVENARLHLSDGFSFGGAESAQYEGLPSRCRLAPAAAALIALSAGPCLINLLVCAHRSLRSYMRMNVACPRRTLLVALQQLRSAVLGLSLPTGQS